MNINKRIEALEKQNALTKKGAVRHYFRRGENGEIKPTTPEYREGIDTLITFTRVEDLPEFKNNKENKENE